MEVWLVNGMQFIPLDKLWEQWDSDFSIDELSRYYDTLKNLLSSSLAKVELLKILDSN